jgi:Family of unknown function (DUF6496)
MKKKMCKSCKQAMPKGPAAQAKIKKVLKHFKEGTLNSGAEEGPVVKKRSQAVAIALNSARKKKK